MHFKAFQVTYMYLLNCRTVQGYLGACGRINRVIYEEGGQAPLFPIDTPEFFDIDFLKRLIAELPKMNEQLETALRGMSP